MFNFIVKRKEKLTKKEKPSSSPFSDFFRKASSAEKKRVFSDVAKKASETQKAYMR